MFEFRHVGEHIEVYLNGRFLFSADNIKEAYNELEEIGERSSAISASYQTA